MSNDIIDFRQLHAGILKELDRGPNSSRRRNLLPSLDTRGKVGSHGQDKLIPNSH